MPINRSFGGRNRGANPHGGRLPPGQSLVDNFPVLTAGPAPRVPDLADWGLTLKVGPKPLRTWSWQEFNALPQTERLKLFKRADFMERWLQGINTLIEELSRIRDKFLDML